MALKFNESTYLKSKLAQCNEDGLKDASGNAYTLASLKAAIEKAGFTLEEHYHKYADSEGTHAYGNMDFDEDYYLESKLAQLTSTGHTGWTKAALIRAIHNIGLTVEQHFQKYSTTEGTSANPYFNTSEYLAAKLNQLQNNADAKVRAEWADKSVDDVAAAIKACGMSAEEHYARYGCKETDASGNLINPSNAFDANGYASAKLAELQKTDPANWSGKSAADVMSAITKVGMTPVSHYEQYGQAEAEASNTPMVQTVPVVDRVANDSLRNATGDNVPSNYNKSTPAPSSVTTGSAVTKPCDVADSATEKPSEPVATPSDANYVPVPGNGVTDTNSKPVEIVTATTVDANGNEVTVAQYGVTTTTDGGSTTKGIDATGKVTTTDIKTVANGANGSTTTTTNVTQGSTTIQQTAADDGKGTVETTTKASLNGGANTIEQSATTTTGTNGRTTTETETTVKNADGKTVMTQTATETANASGSRTSTDYTTTNYDAATGEVTGTQTGTTTKTTTSAGTETTKTNATVKDADGNTTGTISETITKSTDANGNAVTKVQGTEKDASGKTVTTTSTTTTESRDANGTLTTKTEGKSTDADGNTTTISETATTVTNPRTGTVTENKVVDNVTTDSTGKTVATESGTVKSTTTADGSATKTTNITETATDANGNTTSTKTDTTAQFDASKGTTTNTGTQTTTGANGKSETTTVNETKVGDSAGTATTPSQQSAAESSSGNTPSAEEPTEDENKDDEENKDNEQGNKDDEQGGSTEPGGNDDPTPTSSDLTLKDGTDGYSWDSSTNTLTLTFTEDIASINGSTEAEKLAHFTVSDGGSVVSAGVKDGKVVLTLSGTDGLGYFNVTVDDGAVVGKTSGLANASYESVWDLEDDPIPLTVEGGIETKDADAMTDARSVAELVFKDLPEGVKFTYVGLKEKVQGLEYYDFSAKDGKVVFSQGSAYEHSDNEDSHTFENVALELQDSNGRNYTTTVSVTIIDDKPTVTALDGSTYAKKTISMQGGETSNAFMVLDFGADDGRYSEGSITISGPEGISISGENIHYKPAGYEGEYSPDLGRLVIGSDGKVSFEADNQTFDPADITFTFTDSDGDSVSATINLEIKANGSTDPDNTFYVGKAYHFEQDGVIEGNLVASNVTGLKAVLTIDGVAVGEARDVKPGTDVTFNETCTLHMVKEGGLLEYRYTLTLPSSAKDDHTYKLSFTKDDSSSTVVASTTVLATDLPEVYLAEVDEVNIGTAGAKVTSSDYDVYSRVEFDSSFDVYQKTSDGSLTVTNPGTDGKKVGTLTYDANACTFSFTLTASCKHGGDNNFALSPKIAIPVKYAVGGEGTFVVNPTIRDAEPENAGMTVEWDESRSVAVTVASDKFGADNGDGKAIEVLLSKNGEETTLLATYTAATGWTCEINGEADSKNQVVFDTAKSGLITLTYTPDGGFEDNSFVSYVSLIDDEGDYEYQGTSVTLTDTKFNALTEFPPEDANGNQADTILLTSSDMYVDVDASQVAQFDGTLQSNYAYSRINFNDSENVEFDEQTVFSGGPGYSGAKSPWKLLMSVENQVSGKTVTLTAEQFASLELITSEHDKVIFRDTIGSKNGANIISCEIDDNATHVLAGGEYDYNYVSVRDGTIKCSESYDYFEMHFVESLVGETKTSHIIGFESGKDILDVSSTLSGGGDSVKVKWGELSQTTATAIENGTVYQVSSNTTASNDGTMTEEVFNAIFGDMAGQLNATLPASTIALLSVAYTDKTVLYEIATGSTTDESIVYDSETVGDKYSFVDETLILGTITGESGDGVELTIFDFNAAS